MCVLYLLAPVFIALDRHPRWYWSIAVLVVLGMLAHRPLYLPRLSQNLLYFPGAYVAGVCFSHFRERIHPWLWQRYPWLFVIAAMLAFIEVGLLHRGGAIFSEPFARNLGTLDINLPMKLLLCLGFLPVLDKLDSRVRPWLSPLATASFGIFFVHRYLLLLFECVRRRFEPALWSHPGLGFFLAMTSVCLLLSLAFLFLVRRLTGKASRFLVGC